MNKFLKSFVLCATALTMGLTSCDKDSQNENNPDLPDVKDLISSNFPSQGWSGDGEDGILKYATYSYEDDEPNGYFAFDMKNGICRSAVYNIVMPNSNIASQIAKMLNDGSWASAMEDDDDYSVLSRSGNTGSIYNMAARTMMRITGVSFSRAAVTLPVPVQQNGKVIYVVIKNVAGVSRSDLRTMMDIWTGRSTQIPDHVVFGKYENGVYTCSNMRGMNIEYVVNTGFNAQGNCTKYTTKITLPTESWAKFYYEAYEQQIDELETQFGQRPNLSKNGKTVVLDAVIIADVPKTYIDSLIYALDWMNNCPFVYSIFE